MSYSYLIYFLFNFTVFFICAKISYKLKLVDIPNERKIHSEPTAFTGGVAIIIILLFALKAIDVFDKNLGLILSFSFLISIVGLIDDKFHLNTGGKLILQIVPIIYLIVFENFTLNDIGDYEYFDLILGTFAIPFTLFSVLFLINAFNYFDGIDGTLSFTTISVLLILFFLVKNQTIELFFIIITIPLMFFLLFNFSLFKLPKLFLGDNGSLLLGFIISFVLIYLANSNLVHPILLAWSVAIFVYEFLSVNFIRLLNNQNPFQAGQDHIHHLLFNKTKSNFYKFFYFLIKYNFYNCNFSFLYLNLVVIYFIYCYFYLLFFTKINT